MSLAKIQIKKFFVRIKVWSLAKVAIEKLFCQFKRVLRRANRIERGEKKHLLFLRLNFYRYAR